MNGLNCEILLYIFCVIRRSGIPLGFPDIRNKVNVKFGVMLSRAEIWAYLRTINNVKKINLTFSSLKDGKVKKYGMKGD